MKTRHPYGKVLNDLVLKKCHKNILTLSLTAIALFLGEVLAKDEVTTEDKAVYESCDMSLNGEDCIKYPFETCKMTITEDGSLVEEPVCMHKDTFPLLPAEIIPSIILPVLFGIASVAGIGGGLVVVPIAIGMF